MIELKDNEKLYLVENEGCDDTTHGLVIIPDEYFAQFKEFIENLNKNSTYGCMPTISVYTIDQDLIGEFDGEEIFEDDKLYLKDKIYSAKEGYSSDLWMKGEKVI